MGTKSRESIYGSSIRASAERAAAARKEADQLACEAWNLRMLGYKGPAQPSPTLGDALNAGYLYLEVRCLGCDTHQTVALDIVRRAKSTPVHELERYMRCHGVGPALATALVASIAEPRAFRSGRDFSAWVGLVPKQNSSGGKDKLGNIKVAAIALANKLATAWAIMVRNERYRQPAALAA
jgi:hypothetical protein